MNLVDGGYNGEIIIQEEEIIARNWKKGKLKTKNLSKIKLILDEQEFSVQSAAAKAVQGWSWEITYSPKPGNWPLQYLKVNTRK